MTFFPHDRILPLSCNIYPMAHRRDNFPETSLRRAVSGLRHLQTPLTLAIRCLDPSARIRIERIVQILGNRTRRHSRCSHYQNRLPKRQQTRFEEKLTFIRPPPIIPPPNPIRLPAPKQPPILLLIRLNLRREPLLIPRDVGIRVEVGIVPLEVVRDGEAELADDGGPVAAAVVVAGFLEVGGGRLAGAGVVDAVVVGIFEVAVVVVGGEDVVGEVLVRVAGAPFGVLYVAIRCISGC